MYLCFEWLTPCDKQITDGETLQRVYVVCLRGMTVRMSMLAGSPQSVAHHLYNLLPIMVKEESDLYETYAKVAERENRTSL